MVNILIILMTIGHNSIYKFRFNRSFDKNVKLHFVHWSKKNIINYIIKNKIDGIILSGSKYMILDKKKNLPKLPKKILNMNIPILGICYGYQYLVKNLCSKKCISSLQYKSKHITSNIITEPFKVSKKMYKFTHFDYISCIPKNWKIVIRNKEQIWMAYNKRKKIIGIQFHPEAIKKTRKIFFRKWIKYISKK